MKISLNTIALSALVWLTTGCDKHEEIPITDSKPRKKAGPVEHIDSQERIAAMKLVAIVDPVEKEGDIFMAEVRGAFDEKQFDKLEALAGDLRRSKELFRDGSWKIRAFYDGLDNRFHTGEDGYLTDLETHEAWRKAHPDSVTQRIAMADLYTSYAWHARGSGYAHTVTSQEWDLMRERLDQAAKALKEARELANASKVTDICWYSVAIHLGLGQEWEKETFDQAVADAMEVEPTYWGVAAQRAYSLLPRWYGEEGDWEAFAARMADDARGPGDEVYARIVMNLSGYYADVFRDAKASWPRTRNGMEALLAKYPESVTLQNQAAYLGTLGRDREYAKRWFDKLGENYIEDVWEKPERFVHFRGWAETGEW